jgi:hypothetical protein
MPTPEQALRNRLSAVPAGQPGWRQFEDVATDVLSHLFVPPLQPPMRQPRSYSGTERRDAVLANRNHDKDNAWGQLLRELDARMVLFEFKNYDKEPLGKDEVNQTRNYLTPPIGRLGIVVCRTPADRGAHVVRNGAYSQDRKVILFLSPADLAEMLYMKERGEDPSDFVMDAVEHFYIQYE